MSYAGLVNKKLSEVVEMRKENPVRYSSAVGEAWLHAMFKVKYCHPIFDDEVYREAMHTLLQEAAYQHGIVLGEMGFDNNHVHFLVDIGMYKREEVAKLLRGYSAKKFFELFPGLKHQKNEGGLFWNSGLWNPAYFMGSPRDVDGTIRYIRKQKYGMLSPLKNRNQTTLAAFAN